MDKAFFVAGKRTVFGKAFKGCYKDVRPDDLTSRILFELRLACLGRLFRQFDQQPETKSTGPQEDNVEVHFNA